MKKKSLVIGLIVIIMIVTVIYLLTRPVQLGNISNKYPGPTTLTSTISFSAEAGDRIKFSFRSNVKSGTLEIVLYDSEGNAVYQLDNAAALETFFNLEDAGSYTLAAECSNFMGDYNIKVLEAK